MSGTTRAIALALLSPLLVCTPPAAPSAFGLIAPPGGPVSLADHLLTQTREAAAIWEGRHGPSRTVVDVVCLVPDVPTFLTALSSWDEDHWFPILLDDVPYTAKFLRAFRPRRVIRYPSVIPASTDPDLTWNLATSAALKSWGAAGVTPGSPLLGDAIPPEMAKKPPGVVVTNPESPSFAAAVALAAGHFQPLLRWRPETFETTKILNLDEVNALTLSLRTRIADHMPIHGALGDDCDFVTLGIDLPDRYRIPGEENALDDLISRNPDMTRWAYLGRLIGGPVENVYRAMCSLFLQPRSAMFFNGYSETEQPWVNYQQDVAARTLGTRMPVTQRSGEAARLGGWHTAFNGSNPHGLIFQNSSGGIDYYTVSMGVAQTADIPSSIPTIVIPIHSYSAKYPRDPLTIAGRWLVHGAYFYYGSLNEPFLDAFRPSELIVDLLAKGLPFSVAVRQVPGETRGMPWRLTLIGDPLYRLDPSVNTQARLAKWAPLDAWPTYAVSTPPPADSPDSARFAWALKTAIARGFRPGSPPDPWMNVLLGINRASIPAGLRGSLDELVVDALDQARRPKELRARVASIPTGERSAWVRAMWETTVMHQLQTAVEARDLTVSMPVWDEILRSDSPKPFKQQVTDRLNGRIGSGTGPAMWRARLKSTLRALGNSPDAEIVAKVLKELESSNPSVKARRN